MADNHPAVFIRWGYQIITSSGALAYTGWNIDDIEILGASNNQLAVSSSTNTTTEGAGPATGTIHATPPPVNDLVVHLTSNDTTEATVPATVTVPAGQTTATFPITILDDTILDGSQNTTIAATAVGFPDASHVIAINDNETATLTLTLPPAANENSGAVQGSVSLDSPAGSAVIVQLSTSDADAVQTPVSVTIPSGLTSVDFALTILDDNRISGTHAATITAHVANWTDATAEIFITDNEATHLSLSLPAQCIEGASFGVTVSIPGTLAADLVVALVSGNPSRLPAPPSVTIPAGATAVTFPLAATDNTLTEGTQAVTLTASASGFTGAGGGINVADNTAQHFSFSTISSPQAKGASIDVTITAQDASNATVTGYAGTPVLTAVGASGAVTISPSAVSGFVDGVWTGSVVIHSADTNIVITATDGIGRSGSSNSFNVIVPVDFFTEMFNANRPNDVSNQSFLFTPDGSPGFYAVQRAPVSAFPTDPTGGIGMVMNDDTYVQFNLSGGTTVKLYGTSYATYYVGSNGYVTFGSGDSNSSVSLANHFGKPHIAALFDDLFPITTRQVTRKQTADRVAITWQGVPESGTNDSNSFQIEMFFDGRIRITCLGIAASDGLIGLSKGLGTPSGFVMSDFSAYPTFSIGVEVPAITTEGAAPVMGTLTVSPAPTSNLIVSLSSGDTTEATVPTSVTLLAGQTTTTFPIAILDDAVLDGTQYATLTASASGYAAGAGVIAVQDNETTSITVSVPASTTEGVGTVQGTITLAAAPASAVSVNLTSSDTTVVTVPSILVIAAGQTSANFTIPVVDNALIDGTQPATITAHVANWTDGSAGIAVQDNETTQLALTLPGSVSESGAGTGIVSISGALATPLTVSLASGNVSRLAVPPTATIPAGFTSTTFNFTAPNNTLTDGQQFITITAGAAGFTNGNGSIYVTDDDVHHYEISVIASPQVRGVPFSVTLTAKDFNNTTISNHIGTADLAASGSGGAASITPVVTTAFAGGVWTGNVTVNDFASNLVITASDGAGHAGASNPFTVGVGSLHHFGWSPVATQVSGSAFGATITARDVADNTVTNFTGTTSLSGFTGSSTSWTLLNNPVFANKYTLGTYTLGYSFTPSSNILVTAVRSFSGTKVSIWTNTGTLLASVPVTTTPGTWTDTPLASPLQLQVGVTYRIGVLTGGAPYYARADMGTTFPHGSLNQSYSSSGNVFPTTVDSVRWWFVDMRYTIGSPVTLSPATTGAFTSGVWAGNLTVSQAGAGISLYANDGSGHFGQSNIFDVLLTPPSTNANLAGLSLSAGTLTPVFNGGTTSYTASVSNATSAITLTPTTEESHATVTVNGTTVASGNASAPINLAVGGNPIVTAVTAQDGITQQIYTVSLTRRTPYQDWAVVHNLGGPAEDSDGDGWTNLLEWAFATDPASAELSVLRVNGGGIETHGGPAIFEEPDGSGGINRFALFARRKNAAAAGLGYSVEFSNDLTLWEATTATPTTVAEDAETEAVTVPFPDPGDAKAAYFRIRITSQ
ncbi:MAG: cadherin-like beta sandwich domain-containing protein [Luteolibacter sp.]|nr:cadherin-like beta sandwich domain-containing protein [Luteolibacter sp.]